MRRKLFLAIVTLRVNLNKLSDKSVLHSGFVIKLFLNGKLNSNSFGMRLRPNKACLENFDSIKPFYFFEKQG